MLMTRLLIPAASGLVVFLSSAPLMAQAPAHVAQVDGQATVERASGAESAVSDLPILAGDRIRTDQGRLELLLGDGSVVHMDEQTAIDVNAETVVRLLDGRLVVAGEPGVAGVLQVDSAPGSVRLVTSGEVRLSLITAGDVAVLDVGVVRGEVEVVSDAGVITVGAGERVLVNEGEPPSLPVAFNSARQDAFYRWSDELLDSRRGTTSASYLPSDLVPYGGTFDQYGTWAYQAPYGNVWYPTVAAGWRPYYRGAWRHVGDVGWTFVGRDPWAWPTHHYGRWGLTPAGVWFWIPSSGWSAAWVQWAVAPDYVSWCPLGWNNRPISRFWDSGGRPAREGAQWRGWSTVSSGTFADGGYVPAARVDSRAFRGPTAPPFIVQNTPPNTAVGRGFPRVPSRRMAGPAEAPQGGRSRGSVITTSPPSRRGVEPPAAASSGFAVERGSAAANRGGSFMGTAVPARSRATRTPAPAGPPVIYYRGTSIPPAIQRSPAVTGNRAGIAVPRGLPAYGGQATTPYSTGVGAPPYLRGSVPAPRPGNGPVKPAVPGGVFGAPTGRAAPGSSTVAVPRAPSSGGTRATPAPQAAPPASTPPAAAPRQAPSGSAQGIASPRSSPHR
jgi:Family of unknown function (DUF6600)/FecR protein